MRDDAKAGIGESGRTRRAATSYVEAGEQNVTTTHINMLSNLSRRGLGIVSRGLTTVHRQRMASFSVKSLDHVVITAKDIPTTIEFYTQRLGMKHEVFKASGGERHALSFGNQKLNLHQSGKEFEPKAQHVQPGSEDLCFITDHPIDEVLKSWQTSGIEVRSFLAMACIRDADRPLKVLEGGKVVERTGAVGKLRSVYCRDPDGNLIE